MLNTKKNAQRKALYELKIREIEMAYKERERKTENLLNYIFGRSFYGFKTIYFKSPNQLINQQINQLIS